MSRRLNHGAANGRSAASVAGPALPDVGQSRTYNGRMLKPLQWTGQSLRLLDQTRLPAETTYVEITDEQQMHYAIRRLVVRGAPAIGIAAAFGVYLGIRGVDEDAKRFMQRLDTVCEYLATSRPTAVNLFWALERVKKVANDIAGAAPAASPPCHVVRDIQEAILDECLRMIDEDNQACRAIGKHGLDLLLQLRNLKSQIPDFTILTHCNAGGLATAGYGTALAPVYVGVEQGIPFHVYADETRPLLQGSRITAYELQQNRVPVTLICDSMAATVLRDKQIDAVIVGADRIAANGDTANKIGTLPLAIAARHFGVPFLVAAPLSTMDFSTASGEQIPIEQRCGDEVCTFAGRATAPPGVSIFNPAFDITPADLITAIVTESGVAKPPFSQSLEALRARKMMVQTSP